MLQPLLIYGAAGFTGQLIAAHARAQGLAPMLAGRSRARLAAVAASLGLEWTSFELADTAALERALTGQRVVVHAAGPFAHTWAPMVAACLRTGTHYIDITGEAPVIEAIAARDRRAKDCGIMLLPGAGGAPGDCLAAFVAGATHRPARLRVANGYQGQAAPASRGTLRTALEQLRLGTLARRGSALVRVPAATQTFDFGSGPILCIPYTSADLITAYYSTGIADISTFLQTDARMRRQLRVLHGGRALLATSWGHRLLALAISRRPEGPSAEQRAASRSCIVAEVDDAAGAVSGALLVTPNGYTVTAACAVLIAQHVLRGDAKIGFQTPSLAYGADLVMAIDGVTRRTGGTVASPPAQ